MPSPGCSAPDEGTAPSSRGTVSGQRHLQPQAQPRHPLEKDDIDRTETAAGGACPAGPERNKLSQTPHGQEYTPTPYCTVLSEGNQEREPVCVSPATSPRTGTARTDPGRNRQGAVPCRQRGETDALGTGPSRVRTSTRPKHRERLAVTTAGYGHTRPDRSHRAQPAWPVLHPRHRRAAAGPRLGPRRPPGLGRSATPCIPPGSLSPGSGMFGHRWHPKGHCRRLRPTVRAGADLRRCRDGQDSEVQRRFRPRRAVAPRMVTALAMAMGTIGGIYGIGGGSILACTPRHPGWHRRCYLRRPCPGVSPPGRHRNFCCP